MKESSDMEAGGVDQYDGPFRAAFSQTAIRRAFIRKVYTLLMTMLAITFVMCTIFRFIEPLRDYVQKKWWLVTTSMLIYITITIIIICCGECRRRFPLNLILLGTFTMSFSFQLAAVSAFFDTLTVLMALGTTMILCLMVMLISCQTKIDITSFWIYIYIIALTFLLFSLISGIVQIFVETDIHDIMIAGTGTLIFTLFLMYDTQQIVGGRRVEISPEDYVSAAIQLYVDMMQLFVHLLRLCITTREHNQQNI